jgi:HSP20 family molecular chaperone IbpA
MAELTVKTSTEEPITQDGNAVDEQSIVPAVDIYERDTELVVLADMPGLEKENITVSTEKGVLTIRGSRGDVMERDYNWQEFDRTSYFRQFRLGDKIDQTRIVAEYKQGVLTVKLPISDEVKPRQVDVKVG